jgi:hypothetical protein
MTSRVYNTIKMLVLVLATTAPVMLPGPATAAEAPVKEIVSSHIGWNVDKTKQEKSAPQSERDVCTVASKDECQPGAQTNEAGGFSFPEGLAVSNATALVSPEHGDIYVAEKGNQRVQVFSSTGAFVSTFGATGSGPGQFSEPTSVAVDPATGNVYVEDFLNYRVQEFTASGEFILMFGKEVDAVTKGNICTAASKHLCQAGKKAAEGSTEPGAFDFESNRGELLAIGGPEGLIYVGDKHRVEIFKTNGTPAGEISLTPISTGPNSTVEAITVDQAGNVYVAYKVEYEHELEGRLAAENVVYTFNASKQAGPVFELSPRRSKAHAVEVKIEAIALDPAGRLAVSERERGTEGNEDFAISRGALYEVQATKLHLLTEFDTGGSALSIAFNTKDEMYTVSREEVVAYTPVPVAALSVNLTECKTGTDSETDATVDCELKGEANPWGVPGTEIWFQWGKTPTLGLETPHQQVATGEVPVKVNSNLMSLLPNETYYYRLVGQDKNVPPPELLASEETSFVTPASAPRIVGKPSVVHAGPFSAVMFGELNPENSPTTYQFQYWPCEGLENCPNCGEPGSCPQLLETEAVGSPTYGAIGTTVEARGLRSSTLYHYKLLAKSQSGQAVSETGSFTTSPGPEVTAQTGTASAIAATSAVVSGTVNPDGQAASYAFELGRYNGADTQFGIVFSGPTGAGFSPVPKTLTLTGLQPGTTYAYRISARFGAGATNGSLAIGAVLTLTTEGLPSVILRPTPPPILGVPPIAFPPPPKPTHTCKHGFKRDKHHKCIKPKHKNRKKGHK